MAKKSIVWFEEIGKDDVALVGGKGANLGELLKAGIPVPPGFIVTSYAYFSFLGSAKLVGPLQLLLQSLDHTDNFSLNDVSSRVKSLILDAKMPEKLAAQIKSRYKKLGSGYVAVRSSATAEDMPEASFAGQQSTFLNIRGTENLVRAVQECWASLYEPRAIFYRQEKGYDHLKVGIAVPVQRMVQSETSGVMFTVDPVSHDRNKIVIEAAYGLGEAVVSGAVTPDYYVVDKERMTIVERKVERQEWKIVRNPSTNSNKEPNIRQIVPSPQDTQQKVPDDLILKLVELAKHVENYYGFPQDIEWACEGGQVFVVQTRPVTTLKTPMEPEEASKIVGRVILSGAGASPGIATGPVSIISSALEMNQIKHGDVLVTEMTTPDFVPAMKRAAAIVTDRGGRNCHAAIVSRELGVPCVVGSEKATHILKNSQVVTVDGSGGKIYEGRVEIRQDALNEIKRLLKNKTKVYVNLADPDLADKVAARNVDGVGLLRAEFIVAHIGEHPRYMLSRGRGQEFSEKLANGILRFCKAFSPRPVVYRFTDFKTNEYRSLKGGEEFESVEENPMLGYRGCSRYVADRDVFKLESRAIREIRAHYDNLWLMVPFVRTPQELSQVKALLEEEDLKRSETMKLWMMVEVPSNIFLLEKFISVGIDGISIGSNDLTQLILGVDRDNSRLADLFDERNEAVMIALERAVTVSRRRGITASICGQAPSFFPDLTAKLVEWGISSVSVSPDMIDRTRQIIAEVEEKLGVQPVAEGVASRS